jgi:hypothetical protein
MSYDRKELIQEKRRLTAILKSYSNANDCHCLTAELLTKRILKLNQLIKP